MDPARQDADRPDRRWVMWSGIEAEGRYRGLPTLFFARPIGRGFDFNFVARPERHGYLNPSCWDTSADESDALAAALLAAGWVVTLALRPDQFARPHWRLLEDCHLMVVLDVPNLARLPLKPSDTVRLDSAPFLSHSATFGHLDRCVTSAYRADTPLVVDEEPS